MKTNYIRGRLSGDPIQRDTEQHYIRLNGSDHIQNRNNTHGQLMRCLLVLLMLGCASTKTRRIDAPEKMETEIGMLIHPGMTIGEVESAMKAEGFDCLIERNASFVAKRSWSDKEPRRDAIDFVRCYRTNSAGFMMGRVWSVAILLDGEKSTGEVIVSHYVDGP